MTTVKDRIDEVGRDLDELERRWTEAIRVVGGAYSEAYQHLHDNLPTKLPRDADTPTALMLAAIGGAAGPGAAIFFSPVVAAMVAKGIQQQISVFASGIGSYPDPGPLATPNVDTPLKYQDQYINYISGIFGRFHKLCGWLLNLIAGIDQASVAVNDDHVDQLIGIINNSELVPAPSGYNSWDNNGRLQKEIETAMWQVWVLQLENTNKFMLASRLDLTKPIQRMAVLNLIDGRLVGNSGSERVGMEVELAMLRWATSYQPQRNIIRRLPKSRSR